MIIQENVTIQNDCNLKGSCELVDLIIYPYELVSREFFRFIEKTSFIQENLELLSKVGQNLRLNYKDWPSVDQAIFLFQQNMYYLVKKNFNFYLDRQLIFNLFNSKYLLRFKISVIINYQHQHQKEIEGYRNLSIKNQIKKNTKLFNQLIQKEIFINYIIIVEFSSQNAKKKSIKWSDSEKKLFYWIVMRYYIYKGIKDDKQLAFEEWRDVSKMVLGRNAHQCRLKWEQKYKISLSSAPWTQQEDELLYQVHEEFKKTGKENKWSQISREIYKRSNNKIFRQPKQCRERWINRLDPNISNDPWNKQQEIDLLKIILIRGKKWSELSTLYGRARTENSLKNKYNSLLKKEKMKYEFETINPHIFEKVQNLRKEYAKRYGNITPIEEIDNYECQFIVLAIQALYIEQCLQDGNIEEAQKINNENFFNLFHQDFSTKTPQSILYKKELTISKVDSNLILKNEKCGIILFNHRNNKLYLTPYNVIDFEKIILNQIRKKVKLEDNVTTSSTQSDQNQNYISTSIGNQSIQQLLYLANQPNYYVPLNQSFYNNYWLPPVFPQQIVSSQISNINYIGHQKQFQENYQCKIIEAKKREDLNDIFEQCGADIKIVNSDDEK